MNKQETRAWRVPRTSVLKRLRQEDHEFEVSLSYIERLCLKKKKKKPTTVTIKMNKREKKCFICVLS
jgi:hypothetical protein